MADDGVRVGIERRADFKDFELVDTLTGSD